MNVAAAEAYVERLCGGTPGKEPEPKESQTARRRSVFLMKDLRLFLNTLDRSLSLMRSGGIDAQLRREETEEAVVVTVRIPKNR